MEAGTDIPWLMAEPKSFRLLGAVFCDSESRARRELEPSSVLSRLGIVCMLKAVDVYEENEVPS